MVSRVSTVAFQGIEVLDVDAQGQVASGLPTFALVGLADKAVGESRERVRAALNALGLALPPKRIIERANREIYRRYAASSLRFTGLKCLRLEILTHAFPNL